jgi:hypothetical protein
MIKDLTCQDAAAIISCGCKWRHLICDKTLVGLEASGVIPQINKHYLSQLLVIGHHEAWHARAGDQFHDMRHGA